MVAFLFYGPHFFGAVFGTIQSYRKNILAVLS